MRISIVTEHRFSRTPDGSIWTLTQFPYSYWERYLDVFSSIQVIARVEDVASVSIQHIQASGQGVDFFCIKYYIGYRQFFKNIPSIFLGLNFALGSTEAFIIRAPSIISLLVSPKFYFLKKYAVEAVGDPWEVLSPKVMKGFSYLIPRIIITLLMKLQCRFASVVSYVTFFSLQKRYPSGSGKSMWSSDVSLPVEKVSGLSSIQLDKSFIQRVNLKKNANRIFIVGSFNQNYKGIDLLIKAISILKAKDISLQLFIIGDGVLRAELSELASQLNVIDSVFFLGEVSSGSAVYSHLMTADLFVLPSRTEGMPRAMIEAMSLGLPCIGTKVGGIPELLHSDYLVDSEDYFSLADKIYIVLSDYDLRVKMSLENIETSLNFSENVLRIKRISFYKSLKYAI